MTSLKKSFFIQFITFIGCLFLITPQAISQNTFPNTGKVGIGTSTPSKLLDVNGKSIFRDKVFIESILRYNYFRDTNLLEDRILSITPNGKVRPLRTAFCDSMMIANVVKVGDSSIWIGEEPGGENAIWSTNGPLMLNSNTGSTNEDIYLSSQDDFSRTYVGFGQIQSNPPAIFPAIAATPVGSRFTVLSTTENALCAHTKHTHGIAICSGVDHPTAKFFQGSLFVGGTTPYEKIFIDGNGDFQTVGKLYVGILDKTMPSSLFPPGQSTNEYKMTIIDDQQFGNGYLYLSNASLSPNVAFEAIVDNGSGYLLKSTTNMGGGTYQENVKVTHRGYITLNGTSSGISINGGKFSADNTGDIFGTRLYLKDKVTGTINFKVSDKGFAYAREFEVTTSTFPDYVFEKDYELMPLSEVKKYIEENKHLPGVPSAETIIKDNLKLKEMNLLLFEKVEELTLYIIELNEKIEKK